VASDLAHLVHCVNARYGRGAHDPGRQNVGRYASQVCSWPRARLHASRTKQIGGAPWRQRVVRSVAVPRAYNGNIPIYSDEWHFSVARRPVCTSKHLVEDEEEEDRVRQPSYLQHRKSRALARLLARLRFRARHRDCASLGGNRKNRTTCRMIPLSPIKPFARDPLRSKVCRRITILPAVLRWFCRA
jgi:hypothetical protein